VKKRKVLWTYHRKR